MMNELTYHIEGDYLLPDLITPESPRTGIWGILVFSICFSYDQLL